MPGSREGAIARAHATYDDGRYLDALRALVAVPTESQMPQRLPDLYRYCADVVGPMLTGMGFSSQILENPRPRSGPVLLSERIEDPSRPTVLIYGHGDVVRGLAGQWTDDRDPWAVTVDGNRLYGRGTVDNKGQHLIAIEALRAVMTERSQLGFNARVLVETGEEVGSPGLQELLHTMKQQLASDVFIGLDGPRQTTTVPEMKLGARGGVTFDLVVRLRDGAHHSGHWGGVLADPGFILAHALASLVSVEGRILVKGWTPEHVPESVRRACAALVFEDIPGLPEADPDWGEPSLSKAEKIFCWTSVVMLAQLSGHPDAPTNAVQPQARATVQVRHTVDVPGKEILPALRRHLDSNGFKMVQIEAGAEREPFAASRTDPDDPWVRMVAQSMERTAGIAPNICPNSSGGNPSEMFREELGVPVIWIPNSYAGCGQHGPDEHALAVLLREGLGLMAGVFWDIGNS
jgi:acetylornithine deacetylase/succinyl-diaminopimelate desuccinylase-like protein